MIDQDAKWVTITGPHAFCQGCIWVLHGDDPSVGPKRLMSAARAHAKSSGHRVRIERGQSRYVDPRP